MRPLRHQALALRRLLGQWFLFAQHPSRRFGVALSAAPVVVCGGIQHNAVLYALVVAQLSGCARIRDRYVLRPSGKCRRTSQSQIPSPSSRGSKTGLVLLRPFAFCCVVVPVCVLSCCGRFAAYVGGAFPLTSPHPPSGQVKQRHGRTRPHCHPLPWVNLHPRAPSIGWLPASPAGSRSDGQGKAMLIRSATPIWFVLCGVVAARYRSQRRCILFIAATSRRRHEPGAPSPSRHRCRVRVVRTNKKSMPDKTPAPAFPLPRTTLESKSGLVAARSV